MSLIQFLQRPDILGVKLVHLLSGGAGHMPGCEGSPHHHGDRSPGTKVSPQYGGWPPVGHDAQAVLEDSTADKEDRSEACDGLTQVLDSPHHGAFGVAELREAAI